jgi:bifunctional N-acetylglucosamine-1-phosphate-uridyltransferase/glucosamine-1-phosphate-acetyltransferase GlmU-like protein
MTIEREDIDKLSVDIEPENWSLLIPAAGKGTRLGYYLPKILYPILDRPMLDWLLDIFRGLYEKLIIIVSHEGSVPIEEHLKNRSERNWVLVEQPMPVGMGDAVLRGLEASVTPYTICVWGDQIALKRETVLAGIKVLLAYERVSLTLPTHCSCNPYIHLQRDKNGNIIEVLQAREGDIIPSMGESDCGVFFMRSSAVLNCLKHFRNEDVSMKLRGKQSREFNFLPILPYLSNVVSLRITAEEETLGVNTHDDACRVSFFLAKPRAKP